MGYIQIIFDGPPGPRSGRFIEVHDANDNSVALGECIDRGDGTWALQFDRDDVDEAMRVNGQFGVGA